MSEKKKKRRLDKQYRIYCKVKLLILDSESQDINDTNFVPVLVKLQREVFKLNVDHREAKRITNKIFNQLVREYGSQDFRLSQEALISLINEMDTNKFITKSTCAIF